MSVTLGPNGLIYNNGNAANVGIPFQDQYIVNSNVSAGGGYVRLFDSKTFVIPAKSQFVAHVRTPIRNDTDSWGGAYMDMYYSVNGGSSYTFLGNTGYLTAMFAGKYAISGHNNMFYFNFLNRGQTNFRIRVNFRSYNNTAISGGSHNISNASNSNYTGSIYNWWQGVTINGMSYP